MSGALAVGAVLAAAAAAGALCWLASCAEGRLRLAALVRRLRSVLRAYGAEGTARAARNDARRWWEARSAGRSQRVRAGRCLDELPELLDVLALGLSAGISFDAALAVYCERYDTMLSGRMADAMRSWQLGLASRREALRALADELAVDAFSAFVATVSDSLALGAPLAQTLVTQAESVREARRADQQEQIEKTPVKMLVPIGTLILPAMLLAIMGPLLASLVSTA